MKITSVIFSLSIENFTIKMKKTMLFHETYNSIFEKEKVIETYYRSGFQLMSVIHCNKEKISPEY